MDEKDLLWFASGFRTVGAWRDAMLAHGYSMPLQLCHGLSQAMKSLNLRFPEAFRLLWEKKKILVSGRALIYDFSAAKLWDAGTQPPDTPPAGPAPPAVDWHHDVLSLVPPTKDIVDLQSAWCLAADSSPLMKLALWHPTDEDEQWLRQFLLDFGHEVAAAGWKNPGRPEGVREDHEYASSQASTRSGSTRLIANTGDTRRAGPKTSVTSTQS